MVVDISLNRYIQQKMRSDTALEINENTQSTYRSDLVYLFFKLLMFVILGVVFYFLFKNQNAGEMIDQVKETAKSVKEAARVATEKVKGLAESVKSTTQRSSTNAKV
jgi:preprotein translocase subunit YajC